MKYATLVHSLLELDWHLIPALYDDRGAMEGELKADKSGLLLPRRRKRLLAAQEALILLTDVAHNLATWTQDWMLAGSRFATYGPVASSPVRAKQTKGITEAFENASEHNCHSEFGSTLHRQA